ncbi:protein of unknown function [Shewanella benthica]|uniref:Uncharacterized protein n=1 Tax=Shewanella benthica TaxID=43661 RepID=A0A330M991_9GAMM|nr:protein of unknown function [Shewanella benthica]
MEHRYSDLPRWDEPFHVYGYKTLRNPRLQALQKIDSIESILWGGT